MLFETEELLSKVPSILETSAIGVSIPVLLATGVEIPLFKISVLNKFSVPKLEIPVPLETSISPNKFCETSAFCTGPIKVSTLSEFPKTVSSIIPEFFSSESCA